MLTASVQKGKALTPNKCPGYDTKLFDGEAPATLKNVKYLFIVITPRFTLT